MTTGIAAISSSPIQPPAAKAVAETPQQIYRRTGVDKDAAIGDPDHDAPRKPAKTVAAPAGQAAAPAVTTVNAIATGPTATPAAAANAYSKPV